MARQIPEAVSSFVLTHIHSVTQLELLLWMRGNGERPASVDEIARHHRMQPDMAAGLLEDLRARKLLKRLDEPADSYIYKPERQETAEQMEALADFYTQYRFSIINLIFSRPSETVQSFARSFRVRKDKPDG